MMVFILIWQSHRLLNEIIPENFNNVMQSFGKQDLYPSIEEKAAHLLYFIIKNHPFVDGNKRSGAYAFIWFLNQAKILDVNRITPPALTLLIAESDPKEKEKMVGLVCALLIKRNRLNKK